MTDQSSWTWLQWWVFLSAGSSQSELEQCDLPASSLWSLRVSLQMFCEAGGCQEALPWWRRPLPWRGGCASAPPLPCWRWCWDGSSGSWPWPPRPGGGWRGAGGAASSWRAGLSLQRARIHHPCTLNAHSPLQHPPLHWDTLQGSHPLQHPPCHWDTMQGCHIPL